VVAAVASYASWQQWFRTWAAQESLRELLARGVAPEFKRAMEARYLADLKMYDGNTITLRRWIAHHERRGP
jgi:hypothetical protein